ncbi:MAG: hypothetical protein ACPG4U_09600 [Pseudomonadales bacterium]
MVNNVRDIYDAVKRAGVEPFLPIYTSSVWRTDCMDERTQFMVLDPEDYLLRFSQVDGQRSVEKADIERLNKIHSNV